MNSWMTAFLLWLGFNEPKAAIERRRINKLVHQRKQARYQLERVIRETAMRPQKK